MNRKKCFIKAFGLTDEGFIDFPVKRSNVQIERIEWGAYMGCTWCFPHGLETSNSIMNKIQRSWKKHRKTQWKA